MTIVVEDGTGVSNANSYCSEADFDTYCDDRGLTPSDGDTEAALIRATYALDGLFRGSFPGYKKVARSQALEWPRLYAYDSEGNIIDSDSLPPELVKATCEATLRELADPGALTPDLDRGGDIRRMKAGPVEIEYGAGATHATVYTILAGLLSGILTQNATSSMFGSSSRG